MDKNMKRAQRRKHLARLKRKTKKYEVTIGSTGDHGGYDRGEYWHPSMANTPKPCSCQGCGNPRHAGYGKEDDRLTLQERLAKTEEAEQLKELGLAA